MNTETTAVIADGAPAPAETVAPAATDTVKAPESVTTDTTAPNAAEPGKPEGDKANKAARTAFEKRQLKRENNELRQRLDAIEKRFAPQEPKRPNVDDYGTTAEFNQALDKYVADRTTYESAQAKQRETEEQKALRVKQETDQASQKFVSDLAREKTNYEGIEQVFADPSFGLLVKAMPPEVVTLIEGSDKNVALAYHLATHLDEMEDIVSMSPIQAARELALIEARLEVPKPKTISNAPPPVKPVQANSTKEVDISDPNISDADFNRKRREQRAAKSRRA